MNESPNVETYLIDHPQTWYAIANPADRGNEALAGKIDGIAGVRFHPYVHPGRVLIVASDHEYVRDGEGEGSKEAT